MMIANDLLETIENAYGGISLSELLARHPNMARRTMQRWIKQLLDEGKITAVGQARARRYLMNRPSLSKYNFRVQEPHPTYQIL